MNKDLVTSIAVAILGVVISYFVCNMFVGEIQPVQVKTIQTSVTPDVSEPDPDVFNYKSIDPTVEVYIGGGTDACPQLNAAGECVVDNQGNP